MSGTFDLADNHLKRRRIVKYDRPAEALDAAQARLADSQADDLDQDNIGLPANMRPFRFAVSFFVACASASPALVALCRAFARVMATA